MARGATEAEPPSLVGIGGAGPVMVIGGAEDRMRDKVILARFARYAGGADGHVVVISTASSLGEAATEAYRQLFEGLGIGRVTRAAARGAGGGRRPARPPGRSATRPASS